MTCHPLGRNSSPDGPASPGRPALLGNEASYGILGLKPHEALLGRLVLGTTAQDVDHVLEADPKERDGAADSPVRVLGLEILHGREDDTNPQNADDARAHLVLLHPVV